jgi:hypothetical protein
MKRHAAALLLLAGLSGGCTSTDKSPMMGNYGPRSTPAEVPGVMGPMGEPISPVTSRGASPDAAMKRADYRGTGKGGVQQASHDNMGLIGKKTREGYVATGDDGVPGYYPPRGILPVPAMGPYGAVAAVGAMPQSMPYPHGGRSSIRFSADKEMSVTWYGPNGWNADPLVTPARYNFPQGGIYRLKLSGIQGRPGLELYPTLEVAPATLKTATYLAHSSVPLNFTDEDFEQVVAGNMLIKVIYLPDPQYQDLAAVAGPAEVISTRLEPGVDPVSEARRRGEVLLVIRMGNIDLRTQPPLEAPGAFSGPPPGFGGPPPGIGGPPPGFGPGGPPPVAVPMPKGPGGPPSKLP